MCHHYKTTHGPEIPLVTWGHVQLYNVVGKGLIDIELGR